MDRPQDNSISKQAQAFLDALPPFEDRPQLPLNGSADEWRAVQDMVEERMRPACEKARQYHNARITEIGAGPLRALVIAPETVNQTATPAIYLHGGGYTCYSARSSLFASIPLAAAIGRPLVSLDYPLAPFSACHLTVRLTAAAMKDVLQRFSGASLIGESAGGGLALSAVNDLGGQDFQPRSLILISPWTDLANRGESRTAMAEHDPILQYEPGLRVCAQAYAGNRLDSPNASPLFADYDHAYPPCLILCGSCEILLSDSRRLHEKLKTANAESALEVYKGMFHSFPILAPDLPESEYAMRSMKAFLDSRS
jgi:epsilon-lactone hydrolase